ncbi:uncharacterized protein [Rutidosis leptorrhynchoides]|uniref:uncharacterized protein n=1 Tax=Rutidosis leptorrhynchoides TaxID=125765 RepID=UPI003A9A3EE0
MDAYLTIANESSDDDDLLLNIMGAYAEELDREADECTSSNNDINVLNRSSLFDSIKNDWATLIKAFSSPTDEAAKKFTQFQESARKDVERTFGVLQEDNGFAITSLDEEYLREPENQQAYVRNQNSDRATRAKEILDKDVHNALRQDLTEHIWNFSPNFRRTN